MEIADAARLIVAGDEASAAIQDRLFEQLAIVGKAVASKQRLKLLELLAQTNRTVEALAREANLSVANVSQHLQVLRAAGIVEANRAGLFVSYRLAGPDVLALLTAIRSVAEKRLGEIDRLMRSYLANADDLEPLTNAQLLRRLRTGDIIVIDVRPAEEYAAGHLPGAICMPLPELKERLKELPTNKEVIAYCRGPYCLLAHRAVALLRHRGRRARRLREGFPQWQADGMPVNSGLEPADDHKRPTL
ncbi:MAG TPA: metalloregulator ArsR/SmtB family transcription factor [Candidatus Binataceae bacterium]|nr:metalloregulator ArsR/SmtB family transcription factor [Candidatus Binataceae bacterium]